MIKKANEPPPQSNSILKGRGPLSAQEVQVSYFQMAPWTSSPVTNLWAVAVSPFGGGPSEFFIRLTGRTAAPIPHTRAAFHPSAPHPDKHAGPETFLNLQPALSSSSRSIALTSVSLAASPFRRVCFFF